jgi:outer membrane protein assembly factor BamA
MKKLFFISFFIQTIISYGQQNVSAEDLPFQISHIKKLDSLELAEKKEGTFITGIPDFSSDPLNGFGYGAEGSIIFNGKRNNPFFQYTPYLTKIDIVLFNTSNQQREVIISFDKPYVFKSKWRLRGELAYEINPNLVYFGITDHTLNNLSDISMQDGVPQPPFKGTLYKDYENSLTKDYANFNVYTKQEYILNISGEYSLFNSKMRVLIGGEVAGLNISTPNDTLSRLQKDKQKNNLSGVGKSTITFLQLGIVYDTRDFEPDPNRGIFAEITNEFSNKYLGSDFNMNKIFTQLKWYKRIFPNQFKKFILAARFGIGYTFGNAPFFEYQDEWSSEGSIEGLGGAHTLRGYKQSRFLDRGMYFVNLESRVRFLKFMLFKQNFVFSGVPFFDAGSVFHNPENAFNLNRTRYSNGLGLRIAWNSSTILRFDYAISKEDKQFFFIFGQSF